MADTMEDLKKMKVPELKQALKDRGLPCSGTKVELMKRLSGAMGTEGEVDQGGEEEIDDDVLEDDILNDDVAPPTAEPTPPVQKPVLAPITAPAPKVAAPVTAPADNTVKALTERKEENNGDQADSTEKVQPSDLSPLTAEEKLKRRADKFGAVSADMQKKARAERFGITTDSKTTGDSLAKPAANANMTADQIEQLKKRAERFGAVTSTSLSKVDLDERKRKRAERFGISDSTSTVSSKTTMSINSTDPDLEAKKKKRAERFGVAT